MPRYPNVTPSLSQVHGAVFQALAGRIRAYEGETFPLHIGDTWMEPAEGCRMQDVLVGDLDGVHRYAPVQGLPILIDAIVERVSRRTGARVSPDEVLVSAGATGGLSSVLGALLSPGDEVLIAAPFWPLIAGIVRTFHGVPVPMPFEHAVDAASAAEIVDRAVTPRTVAVYLNTPNNPTGRALPHEVVAAVAEAARRHDLWLLSDEVYEDYVYEGEHVYARPFAPERTLSAYSFSKGFGMSGNRVGYVVGPASVMPHVRKIGTHTVYNAPTAAQIAAARALGPAGDAWVRRAREAYAELGRFAADRLGVPAPQGGTFLFLDVAEHLGNGDLEGFLSRAVDRGLLLAPGPHFGPYPTHVRLCFTSAAPERVRRGVEVLAELLGR